MTKRNKQRGSLTLETAIVLPIFIFIFLFIYSIFGIVSAHNQISHALIQSSKSLSMDPYLYEEANLAGESTTNFWGGLDDMGIDLFRLGTDPYFISHNDWYTTGTDSTAVGNDSEIKRRFVAYLSGGDEDAADEKLQNLRVVDGLSGIDFQASVSDDTLTITIRYSLKYVFDFWDSGEMPVEQSIQVKLWK